jgi:N-acetyl-anhydromuramyl-L-alanine amidase AmpD
VSTIFGEQLRPAYDAWRARYPHIYTLPLEIRPDGSTDPSASDYQPYHIESGVELNGQPWARVQRGYLGADGSGIEGWQKTHEIKGHILLGILRLRMPTIEEQFWSARFGQCQYKVMPASWNLAKLEPSAMRGIWAHLPVEIWAEAARLAFDTTGPGDRSMDWGCAVDRAKMRTFFEERLVGVTPMQTDYAAAIALPSPNFQPGRTRATRYIVRHTTQGTDSRAWLTNAASQVSAQYLVRGSQVYQLVRENDRAWHAGRIVARRTLTGRPTTPLYTGEFLGFDVNGGEMWSVNPNDESIGIELEGFAAQLLPPETIAAAAALIRDIRARRGPLPMVDHAQLSPGDRSDPGAMNAAALDAALAGEEEDDMSFTEEDRRKLDRLYQHAEAYEPLVWIGRLQRWLAKAFRSVFPNVDLTGPDVETNQPFKP